MFDQMYELNLKYYKELTMYILAGKKKLAEVRANELPALIEKAKKSGLPEDAQAAKDLDDMCTRFEKKLYDLELTREIAENISIPVIASGGAGRLEHFKDALTVGKADAALAASLFHYKELEIRQVKEYLREEGVAVRM